MVDVLCADALRYRPIAWLCGVAALGRKERFCTVLLCSETDVFWRNGDDRHAGHVNDGADAGAAPRCLGLSGRAARADAAAIPRHRFWQGGGALVFAWVCVCSAV